jgi:hypothetical protein
MSLEKINETYAWNKQDIFVAEILKRKRNGTYVEIGSNDPKIGNNTYLLEKNYEWKGLSIDIEPGMVNKFNEIRKNKAILADAVTFNYSKYFEENNFPKQIDYLSVDVDGNFKYTGERERNNTLLSLITLPLTNYRFSVIHYEHESGNYLNIATRDAQREILTSLEYYMLVSNIEEDWWVDPQIIPWTEARLFCHFDQGKYQVISN